jgi:hypothetical protein
VKYYLISLHITCGVILEIILIEETKGGGTSGGGIGNIPIRVESLSRPTPTFSYSGSVFAINDTLLVQVLELKKASLSIVMTFPLCGKCKTWKRVDTTVRIASI